MNHILEVSGVQFEFKDRRILSDVYLKCETGKITGLLGRNGQGKSSLMQIIYGSLICEKSIIIDRISRNNAYKFPELLLYLPQFKFIPKSLSLKKIFRHFDLDYLIFQNRFPEFKTRYNSRISQLSGGQQRFVEVYLIIKSKTQFVMLDEPFTHLNPTQIDKVKELLLEEKNSKGILITDHMYQNVIDISDTLYVLTKGKTHLTKSIEDIETLGYARFR
jgi:ABC-type multidrug transport system ATPase subunit